MHAPFIVAANGLRRFEGGALAFFIASVQVTRSASVVLRVLFAAVPTIRARPLPAVVCLPTTARSAFIAFQMTSTGATHFCSGAVSFAMRAGAAVAAVVARPTSSDGGDGCHKGAHASECSAALWRSPAAVTVAAMRPRAAAGGLVLALSAGWNVAAIGAVADPSRHAYGVSLAVVGLLTTALLRHARGRPDPGRTALRPLRRAARRARRRSRSRRPRAPRRSPGETRRSRSGCGS